MSFPGSKKEEEVWAEGKGVFKGTEAGYPLRKVCWGQDCD